MDLPIPLPFIYLFIFLKILFGFFAQKLKLYEKDDFSVGDTGGLEKKYSSSPNRSRTM